MQTLGNTTKARKDDSLNFSTKLSETSPQNSLKLLPHWHQLPKWATSLEGLYKMCSSINCVFLNKRVECTTHIQLSILGGRQTILRPKDCNGKICHKDKTKKDTSNQKIPIEASNQRISIEPTRPNIVRATRITILWYQQRIVLKKLEKVPMICEHQ